MTGGKKDTDAPWTEPEMKERERGRRRALSSTRSRDRRAGAAWDDGLIALPPTPGTLTVRGAFTPVFITGLGPHGFTLEFEGLGCPERGDEIHVGIPSSPLKPGLLTVVGKVADCRQTATTSRRLVQVALARHGGVPADYWDVVTYWAERS